MRAYHILWMRCVFARMHVQLQTRSPHLRNGCTDFAEIWFAVSGAYSHKLGTFLLPIQGITARARRICTCTPMLVQVPAGVMRLTTVNGKNRAAFVDNKRNMRKCNCHTSVTLIGSILSLVIILRITTKSQSSKKKKKFGPFTCTQTF